MVSSRRCANIISSIASFIYFLVIILQFPLFRVPCGGGICKTPLELTCSQLMGTKLIPEGAVKGLLYPGAFANALFTNKLLPNFNHFLHSYHLPNGNNYLPHLLSHDIQRLEVVAGSYLSVGGSFVGLIKPGRTSLFGTLMLIWGLSREVFMTKSDYLFTEEEEEAVYINAAPMSFALILAFFSVRKDIRKIYRCFKTRPNVKLSNKLV